MKISHVKFYGGGPQEKEIHSRISLLQIEKKPIEMGGYLDRHGAAELYKWADFVIIPSRIESIPVIFSDCMQANTPVIVTPVGDLPRLVDNYGVGVIAENVSSTALATAIRSALQSPPSLYEKGLALAAHEFKVSHSVNLFLNSNVFGD